MKGVFIAGTDTGVGKTRISVGLLQALAEHGLAAVGMKPVATGGILKDGAVISEDALAISEYSAFYPPYSDLNPYCFEPPVSPHIGAEQAGISIDLAHIQAAAERLAGRAELLVMEGTGGWLCPIGPTATMADVARTLKLPVLLVVGMRLGCLNHALLSAQAVRASGCELIGWVGSVLDAHMAALAENRATLAARLGAPALGWLPFDNARTTDAHALALAARTLAARPSY